MDILSFLIPWTATLPIYNCNTLNSRSVNIIYLFIFKYKTITSVKSVVLLEGVQRYKSLKPSQSCFWSLYFSSSFWTYKGTVQLLNIYVWVTMLFDMSLCGFCMGAKSYIPWNSDGNPYQFATYIFLWIELCHINSILDFWLPGIRILVCTLYFLILEEKHKVSIPHHFVMYFNSPPQWDS